MRILHVAVRLRRSERLREIARWVQGRAVMYPACELCEVAAVDYFLARCCSKHIVSFLVQLPLRALDV